MTVKLSFLLASAVLAGHLAPAAEAQDQRVSPVKPPAEEYPRWSVSGVLSTDVSALLSDRGSRDTMPEEGIVGEYSLGGTLHASRDLRIVVRACVGCHGFELKDAYADFDLSSGLTVRAGRLPVPFGGLSRRTSPSQVESSSKPLPFVMGFMPRRREFNLGIVPAPIVDNGAAILARARLGEDVQVDFEAAVVRGLKGGVVDIDFEFSREFRDTNGEPAGAARTTLVVGPLTLGISGMGGHYDAEGALRYAMAGADLSLGWGDWNLRIEAVWRETEFIDASGGQDASKRLAYAAQIDVALGAEWRAFALSDGLRVEDLFLGPGGSSPFPVAGGADSTNTILRTAAGAVWAIRPGLLLKGSVEFWNFSDFDDTWVFHAALVASF